MKAFKNVSLAKKTSAIVFALLVGLSLVGVSKASADEGSGHDGRHVYIGDTKYYVRHNDSGPYIQVMGNGYYLSPDNNDRTVVVNGVSYHVYGSSHMDHDGDYDND